MNRDIHSNLEYETPAILVNNGCRKQGRGVLGLLFIGILMFGSLAGWGQTKFSGPGLYYIANHADATPNYSTDTPSTNWYLVPASDGDEYGVLDIQWAQGDPTNPSSANTNHPLLTTYHTYDDPTAFNNSIWEVIATGGTNEYKIKHHATGKYVVYNTPNYTNRRCFHLDLTGQETASVFVITANNNGGFQSNNIKYTGVNNAYLNPSKGNRAKYYGEDYNQDKYITGLIGYYTTVNDVGNKWHFEHAINPIITYDYLTNHVSIGNPLTGSYNDIHFYYTTDGNTPTSSSTEFTAPFEPTGACTIKAIAIRGSQTSDVISLAIDQVETPTISIDAATYQVTISGEGDAYYYTTDGTDPIVGINEYTGPFTLDYSDSGKTIKAIAMKVNMIPSEVESAVATWQCKNPVISFNNTTQKVEITCEDEGATISYTTDGSDPIVGTSPTYSAPFTVFMGTTVKAIATHTGYLTSDMATLTIAQVATPTIQNNGSNAISITCDTPGASIYYTLDGSTPTTSSNLYTTPLQENASGVTIKAIAVKENMIDSEVGSGLVTLQCETPVITRVGMTFTLSCSMPASATLYYTLGGGSETEYTGPVSFALDDLPMTVTAVARHSNYTQSETATFELLNGTGTPSDPYLIYSYEDFVTFVTNVNNGTTASACYKLEIDVSATGINAITTTFTGTFDGDLHTITDLAHPLFNIVNGGTVKNVILKEVEISEEGNVGAICREANGAARIYNCGILPTDPVHIAADPSTVASSNNHNCGSLVGLLDGTARVINCFSYAWITKGGGGNYYVGGIVGNNSQTSEQADIKTIVVNCMFYGDIDTDNCSNYYPVYGNKPIKTESSSHAATGINPYDFFREQAAFDNTYGGISDYNRSWPALEEYLTRYEYYRSILNSNRRLCTWWVDGTNQVAPNDADIERVGIAKWVLDPSIAPYPILKRWGKYPSIINPDPEKVWDTATGSWRQRANAAPYQGKSLGTLSITVNPGNHAASGVTGTTITRTITDMDTLNFDYGYCKVQLPYYNELFGNPSANPETQWDTRYGGNYKDYVVTGWKITSVTGGTQGSFEAHWEHGYNFADRYCTDKDLYSVSGRVFAQGGYYYVPEGVTAITIEAYWGKAVYLHNTGHYLDRVDITNYNASNYPRAGEPFTPSGTLPTTFQGQPVYQSWKSAVLALPQATLSGNVLDKSVYDQAIVLLNNLQWRNENDTVGTRIAGGTEEKYFPYTIMSIDQDLDNEPDYCFELQFRRKWPRPGIQPIRFDFLPVPELGMAVRHNENQNTIGIFIPLGHFEITETSFMHTTQFEYDGAKFNSGPDNGWAGTKVPAPVILNGGHFEQIVVRYGPQNTTQYIIMGGHFRMLRFTPGAHTNRGQSAKLRLCAVNAIGGEYPEFYLSGIYRPDINPESITKQGNPHCYTNGGMFGLIAGAGYDKILGSVYFKIDHSIIGEFYGGGINGSNPIGGSIDVTIDHSLVEKYCGGPKIGAMENGKTVTTHATGTTFTKFYGGGNGGTSYYRDQTYDGNDYALPAPNAASWGGRYKYDVFNPLNTINGLTTVYDLSDENKGYHALFEFECFVESNGLGEFPTVRSYINWAQFGTTITGDVTNTLTDCTIKESFYGGGNLANVNGNVNSTLIDCTVKRNVFGGGYSGKIEPFRIHDKDHAHFPHIDGSGLMQDGLNRLNSLEYIDREYTWCYKNAETGEMFPQGVVIPANADTATHATFEYDGKWYVLTKVSLEHLGAVSGNVSLTLKGNTMVGTVGDDETGDVFGGGNESDVDGNTEVKLQEGTHVLGNVFGGGNIAPVGGKSKVIIEDE